MKYAGTIGTGANRNIGRLASVSSPGSFYESFTYDNLARLVTSTTNADAASFVVDNSYNANTGLLETTTYPTSTSAVAGSRFKVKYEYDYGLLKRTRDFNTPATIYWERVATNASGQAIDEQLGNGLHTYSNFDGITGLLGARQSGSSNQVQNLTYQWDKVGNLTQRRDVAQNLTEDFYYDNLNRLDYSRLNGVATPNLDVGYDALGNITSKTGIGSYTYAASGTNSVRPHAVTAAGSNSYAYDNNGNMTTRNGSTIAWTSYNLPSTINKGSNSSQFFYGADRQRYKQIAVTAAGGSLPAGTETTIYVGSLYERVTKPSGVIEHKHTIMAGGEAIAIRTLRSNSANDTRYLHKDHLGSVDVITNESGAVVQRLSYDAFGKRRDAAVWAGAPNATAWTNIASITHRAFTFHEQLDNVDLVHMNGRVYDPDIGRFISADPFIQAPLMSQSLNRYSYVMNNPLSFVDPSGFGIKSFLKKLHKFTMKFTQIQVAPLLKYEFQLMHSLPGQRAIDNYILNHQWAYMLGQAAASYWGGPYGAAAFASYYSYQRTGSMTQAVRTGLIVYATSVLMQGPSQSATSSYDMEGLLAHQGPLLADATGVAALNEIVVTAPRITWGARLLGFGGAIASFLRMAPAAGAGAAVGLLTWTSTASDDVIYVPTHAMSGSGSGKVPGNPNMAGASESATGGPEQFDPNDPQSTVLQRGTNKIRPSTARTLNKNFDMDLNKREWGRAVEELKVENGLPPDYHGAIMSNGDYIGPSGRVIGNLLGYVK